VATTAGMHRWMWDLRHTAPEGFPKSFPISAIYRDTPAGPLGPLALPRVYQVKLTVDGKTLTQKLTVKMDPRVKTSPLGIVRMHFLSMDCLSKIEKIRETQQAIRALRLKFEEAMSKAKGTEVDVYRQLVLRTLNLEGAGRGSKSYGSLASEYLGLMTQVDQADAMPTAQQLAGLAELGKTQLDLDAAWAELQKVKP
jgi:hypothetical protein